MLGVVAPPGLQEYVAWPALYSCVISCCVRARFQIPMSSSLPLKKLHKGLFGGQFEEPKLSGVLFCEELSGILKFVT